VKTQDRGQQPNLTLLNRYNSAADCPILLKKIGAQKVVHDGSPQPTSRLIKPRKRGWMGGLKWQYSTDYHLLEF